MQTYQIDHLIASGFSLLIITWLTMLAARAFRRGAELRHELRLRVLERFGTEAVVELMRSAEGREWLGRFLSGELDPESLDAGTVQRAAVLILVGLACGAAGAVVRFPEAKALALGGWIAVAWGLALLAARWWLARRRKRERATLPQAAEGGQP